MTEARTSSFPRNVARRLLVTCAYYSTDSFVKHVLPDQIDEFKPVHLGLDEVDTIAKHEPDPLSHENAVDFGRVAAAEKSTSATAIQRRLNRGRLFKKYRGEVKKCARTSGY